jgi:hypothetical protein
MSLRKSPERTQAFLAANRANSRKSTGPRTPRGKINSAWNAVRHGRRTRASSCIPVAGRETKDFQDLYLALHDDIMPAENLAGARAVLLNAARAWRVKRLLDRWIETRTEEDWLALEDGAVPPPSFWRSRLRRPGVSIPDWTITISVWLRWGRGPGRSRASRPEKDARPDRARMHTMVSVHSTGPKWANGTLEMRRTKPECGTNQKSFENMSAPEGGEAVSRTAAKGETRTAGATISRSERTKSECNRSQRGSGIISALGDREIASMTPSEPETQLSSLFRGRSKGTKPEYPRKEAGYRNMSGNGTSQRSENAAGVLTRLGHVFGALWAALTS